MTMTLTWAAVRSSLLRGGANEIPIGFRAVHKQEELG